jgi:hypothetical protein
MCAMIALGLASTAISAAGMVMQGKQAEAMANYQAKAYEQQAAADQQASAYEASRERHKQELLQANARAQVGASGVALAGSPTEVLVANAREGELDLQAIRYGSQLRQNNLRTQAGISRFSGKQAKTASMIGAAGAVVGGLYSTYERGVQIGAIPSDFR